MISVFPLLPLPTWTILWLIWANKQICSNIYRVSNITESIMASASKQLFRFILALALVLAGAAAHAGGLVKWVDEKGVTHYGDSLPPEYASRGNQELSSQGLVIKKTEGSLTPEQRKAREEAAARETAAQKKSTEQLRQDAAIFNTYTSEKEIDVTRDRNLQTVEAKLLVNDAQLKAATSLEDALIMQLAPYAAKGLDGKYVRLAPMTLVQAYEKNAVELKNLNETRRLLREEKQQTIAKFDAEKSRYLELKKSVAAAAGK